ncbi:MAG: TlpA family protein disulfide reductase, partial [Candidatus Limnocylindria bacterium]
EAVREFVERYGITYPILLDPSLDNFYRWSPQFGLPRHYFIDADGNVVSEVFGELPTSSMVELVETLLGTVDAAN